MPLYWRLLLGSSATLIVGVILLALSPFEIAANPTGEQLSILALGALGAIIIDAALIGNALTPLASLKESIDEVDGPEEVSALPVTGTDEVAALTRAYNLMLDRLRAERIRTVRAALRSQEEERARIARELHDEVGQTMTFLLIRLRMKTEELPQELRPESNTSPMPPGPHSMRSAPFRGASARARSPTWASEPPWNRPSRMPGTSPASPSNWTSPRTWAPTPTGTWSSSGSLKRRSPTSSSTPGPLT